MTEFDTASQDAATLETAPTSYSKAAESASPPPRPIDRNGAGSPAAFLGQHRRVGPRRRECPGRRSTGDRFR